MYRKLASISLLLLCTAVALPAQSVVNAPDGSTVAGFGAMENGGTPSYGQVFTAPMGGTTLSNFTFSLANDDDIGVGTGSDLKFYGYLAGWNGSTATSVLYTSPLQSGSTISSWSGMFGDYQFDTGSLTLTPGQMYIAFLSTSGVSPQDAAYNVFAGSSATATTGNQLVYDSSDGKFTDAGSITYGVDSPFGPANLAFSANFAATTTTPEPSELALLGTGLIGLVPMVRRKLRV